LGRTLRIWDLESGGQITAVLKGHTAPVNAVAVGNLRDGRPVVASGSNDGTVRRWELETGEAIGRGLEGHTAPVTTIAVGLRRDGRAVIVSGSSDLTVRVWDLETGECLTIISVLNPVQSLGLLQSTLVLKMESDLCALWL